MRIKALTLYQPWATLVAIGAKHVETRSWATDYRGPLAIHAARVFPVSARLACEEEPRIKAALGQAGITGWDQLPLGAIVAVCELVDVQRFVADGVLSGTRSRGHVGLSAQEIAFGDCRAERYGWVLRNVRVLKDSISVRGAQGLWDWKAPDGLL